MKINYQPSTKRIAVAVNFPVVKGESYRDQSMRRINFSTRIKAGWIKQLQPQWYKEATKTIRKQVSHEC